MKKIVIAVSVLLMCTGAASVSTYDLKLSGIFPIDAVADVMPSDPDVVVDECRAVGFPSQIGCVFPDPTTKHPNRYVVVINNDLSDDVRDKLTRNFPKMKY